MSDFRYPHRIDALRARLSTATETSPAVSAIIVTNLENCRYLSGFTGSNALIIITQTETLFLTDGRYTLQSALEVPGFERVILPQGTDLAKAAAEQLHRFKLPDAGFEESYLTVKAFNALRAAVDGENGEGKEVKLIGKSGLVEGVRAIKDAEEIEKIRVAVALADRGFEYLVSVAKTGMTERELAWKLETFLRENGATKLSFDSIVGAGPQSAMIHGRPGDRVIGSSGGPELLLLDFGAEVNGYCSDITRTIVIGGEPTAEQVQMYEAVKKAQEAAVVAIRPGVKGKDVHQVALDSLTADGLGKYFEHGTGHQLGRVVHDGPAFSLVAEVEMLPGMVVTVEPGAYIEHFGGVRIEDDVLVTPDGYEILTMSSKELIVLV